MKQSPQDKALKKELANLKTCYNRAKSQINFKPELRTRRKMGEFFGVQIEDDSAITTKDVDLFYEEAIKTITDRYASPVSSPVEVVIQEGDATGKEHEESIEDTGTNRVSNYCPKYPNQTAELLTQKEGGCNQAKAAQALFDGIDLDHHNAMLLLAQTGAGKTYIIGSLLKNLIEHGYIQKLGCIAPNPIFYVTKASVVEQTKKVLRDEFGINTTTQVRVVNIEYLRTQIGANYVKKDIVIKGGEECEEYIWNEWMMPAIIIWDECQILAREESAQSKIAQAVNNIVGKRVIQVFASATPFSRVAEAKCFAVATKVKFLQGLGEVELTNENWPQFRTNIAYPADPYEYVEAAVKRLTDKLEPYIVRIKGIRPKHKSFNSVRRIFFKTPEEKKAYDDAWEEFQKQKAKIESDESLSGGQSAMMMLAQLTIFAKKAEYLRVGTLVEEAIKLDAEGFAPVIVVRFKQTQTAIYQELVTKHGWKREDISMIWGGSTEALTAKKKLAKKVKENEAFMITMREMGIDIKNDLGVDIDFQEKNSAQLDFERQHGLLTQKPEDRERERIRFQTGRSRLCILNYKSGGVGLSLHHESKYPNAKPRRVRLTPTYSEKELIQGMGRTPRITSCSDTEQEILYYGGTIEADVMGRVVLKLKSTRQVTGKGEHWETIVAGRQVEEDEDDEFNDEQHSDIMDGVDAFETKNELMEFAGEK
jgi:DNA replication protein DnaC